MSESVMYEAQESFAAALDGEIVEVHAGKTRCAPGHWLVKEFPERFRAVTVGKGQPRCTNVTQSERTDALPEVRLSTPPDWSRGSPSGSAAAAPATSAPEPDVAALLAIADAAIDRADEAMDAAMAAMNLPDPDEAKRDTSPLWNKNDLPDSAFAFIGDGGSLDDEGKTVPRSLRYWPHHSETGEPDPELVQTLLLVVPDSPLPGQDNHKVQAEAMGHLEAHAHALGILTTEELANRIIGPERKVELRDVAVPSLRVRLSPQTRTQLVGIAHRYSWNDEETGGGLYALRSDPGTIIGATPPQSDDRGRDWFNHDLQREQAFLVEGERMVGSFHTHPSGNPRPSAQDLANFAHQRENLGLAQFVGVIVTPNLTRDAFTGQPGGWRDPQIHPYVLREISGSLVAERAAIEEKWSWE